MYEKYTFWLSVLGSITGSAALVIHFWRFLEELPRLNFYFPSDDCGKTLVGYVLDWERINAYGAPTEDKTKFTFYIWSRICNNSDKPITILEIALKIKDYKTTYLNSSSSCAGFVPVDKTSSRSINTIKPIFTIDPYSAVEGYLFFGPYTAIPQDKTNAKLIVVTSRKTFKVKFILHPVPPP
jgi:hypothetical protein